MRQWKEKVGCLYFIFLSYPWLIIYSNADGITVVYDIKCTCTSEGRIQLISLQYVRFHAIFIWIFHRSVRLGKHYLHHLSCLGRMGTSARSGANNRFIPLLTTLIVTNRSKTLLQNSLLNLENIFFFVRGLCMHKLTVLFTWCCSGGCVFCMLCLLHGFVCLIPCWIPANVVLNQTDRYHWDVRLGFYVVLMCE